MSVANVTEISAISSKSFEDALEQGIVRATKTLGNVRSASVMKQHVHVSNGSIVGYQIRVMVTFVVIEDPRRRVRVQEERLDEDRANSMSDEGGPPRPGSSSAITALPLTATTPSSSSSSSRSRGGPRRR